MTPPPGRARRLAAVALLCAAACAPSGAGPAGPAPAASVRAQAALAGVSALPSPLVVSVLPFEDRARLPDLAWLRGGLPDMLVAALARNPSLLVVQRRRLEEVVREQALQLSGRVADEQAVRVGRLAGATVLVTGSVSAADGRVRLDAQLVGVESGAVLGTAEAEAPQAEAAAAASELAARVATLFPGAGDRRTETVVEQVKALAPAAKANETGEALTREGKLFQAMESYERALAVHPGFSRAKDNYVAVLRGLGGEDLVRTDGDADGARVAVRLVERLAGAGLAAELSPARTEPGRDGSVTLRVPVRVRLDPAAVEAVTAAARALGGRVEPAPDAPGGLALSLSADPETSRIFVRAMAAPRRLYLRLQAADGRTLALYSRLRDWRLDAWVRPLDDLRLRLDVARVLEAEAVVPGLAPEQSAALARAVLLVHATPKERATVRLDAADDDPLARLRQAAGGSVGRGGEPPTDFEALRSLLQEAWDPPVVERPWSRGYRPGNERTATVTMALEPGARSVTEAPRLLGGSGDRDFDEAALEAVAAAVRRWSAAARPAPRPAEGVWRVRAQLRLLKDVPALNLITPLGPAEP